MGGTGSREVVMGSAEAIDLATPSSDRLGQEGECAIYLKYASPAPT